ncbi:aquaporin AQPAe.a-like [Haliotis rubra]|uniref:aquaporin AQPAe.a-like n=1 Tax=Haliotis rubra TaxID=36100 RepID=UPI001EE56448|nr:aquaporin AQPAe.a-like [Haliotis rubra]XP_046570301.1 aquaporin AQPAe.a-like [Haliotis rubra]XP_046570302.1 aquaporin AQPAe.a-like [Haliotis rubra]XP_046570303.1 aquaporin AQPAe.a-like [Haliotis rubra]
MSQTSLNSPAESHSGISGALKKIMAEEVDDLKKPLFWRAVIAEFIGCLLLVLFGVGAGLHVEGTHGHSSVHNILTAGFFIAVIISALANVSGAHVNPALSLAFAVTREISFARFFFYAVAQSAGSVAGAALLKVITPANMHGTLGLLQPGKYVSPEQALLVEVIISFFLVFVIFSLIDKGRKDLGGSIPFIIGLSVSVNIFFSGHISGGCINPIRNFGPAVILGDFKNQWIYWVGPMIGSVLGGLVYDKVFSVAAEKHGLLRCVQSRPYEAVSMDEGHTTEKEIEVRTGSVSSNELPKKQPYSESIERIASV